MASNGNGKPALQSFHPKHKFPLYNTVLPLALINELAQPRKTFEEIDVLGNNVGDNNLYELLLVARFNAQKCKEYITEVNGLWEEKRYRIEDLVYRIENEEKIFYVLIDGGRRFRSCIYLRDVGCEECRKKFGEGGCYERHFGDLNVEVRLLMNPSPDELIDRQLSANIHHRVPPYEEARAYYKTYRRRKRRIRGYTLQQHAKRLGRRLEIINQAVGFFEELPVEFQEHFKSGKNPWGFAMELLRLHRAGIPDKELSYYLNLSTTGKYRVDEFHKLVNDFLAKRNSGQSSMIDIFSEEQQKELERGRFKLIVERRVIAAIWDWIGYFSRVMNLFRDGKLGKEDSPFSYKSPLRVFRKFIDILEINLPYMWSLLPKKERNRSREVIEETKIVLSKLEEHASD